jgi:tetratricopeptide (TPR) repeat protein
MRNFSSVPGLRTVIRYIIIVSIGSSLVECGSAQTTPQQRLERATKKLAEAATEEDRFYALNDAAKQSFVLGNLEDARKYARDLLALTPKYRGNWNYGNAIQDANLVLGRIAVREGRMDEARKHLLAAGNSPGSPQMNSFGPNMSLAKDLLENREQAPVLEYFELCRKFWRMDRGLLDQWSQDVKAGKMPDFRANLLY